MREPDAREPPSLYLQDLAGRSAGEIAVLDDDEARHARSLRLGAGSEVVLIDGRGSRRLGRLAGEPRRSTEVVIGGPLPVPEPLDVELGFGAGNRAHAMWLVEKAAEFGVRRITPVATERSLSVADSVRSGGFRGKAEKRALAAVKQSSGGWLPHIGKVESLPDFLDRVADAGDHGIVLHRDGAPLRSVLPRPGSAIALLVGPEGGLTPEEFGGCLAAGFEPGRLGGTVLRFETAGVAAVALIAHERDIDARVPDEDRGEEA